MQQWTSTSQYTKMAVRIGGATCRVDGEVFGNRWFKVGGIHLCELSEVRLVGLRFGRTRIFSRASSSLFLDRIGCLFRRWLAIIQAFFQCLSPVFTENRLLPDCTSPFDSFFPFRYKRNLIKNLCSRATRLCSPPQLLTEIEFLKSVLTKNGYPPSILRKYLKPNLVSNQWPYGPEKCPVVLRLPYIGPVSRKFEQEIRRCVEPLYTAKKWCSFIQRSVHSI